MSHIYHVYQERDAVALRNHRKFIRMLLDVSGINGGVEKTEPNRQQVSESDSTWRGIA